MKTPIIRSVICLVFLALTLMQTSCDDDNGTDTATTAFTDKLTRTWVTTRVALDGTDVTALFEAMEISWLSNNTYAVTSPVPPVWSGSGTYKVMKDGTAFSIERDGNVVIDVNELTETTAVISFQYNASPANGRKTSVSGNYTFEMKPK